MLFSIPRFFQPALRHRILTFFCALATVGSVQAQAPLTVDELLADPQSLKLEFRAAHALQQLAPGDARSQLEQWLLSGGLRYGVSPNTDLYARLAYEAVREPALPLSFARDRRYGLNEISLGLNQRLVPEGRYPALLIGAEVGLADRDEVSAGFSPAMSSWRLQSIAYRSIDPVVLSLAVSYQAQRGRASERGRIAPGNSIGITPLLNFAVNHRVSLSSGLLWRWQQGTRIDGVRWLPDSSQADLLLGLGFSPSRGSSLFLQSRFNVNRGGSAQLVLDWIRTF